MWVDEKFHKPSCRWTKKHITLLLHGPKKSITILFLDDVYARKKNKEVIMHHER